MAPMTTERDEHDAYHATHKRCLLDSCQQDVCVTGDDGVNFCTCNATEGQLVYDDVGAIGAVHDDCRAHFTTLALRDQIAAALEVRKGFELNDTTIAERANNMALILGEIFKVSLLEKPRRADICAHAHTEERRPAATYCLDCGRKMPMDSTG